MDIELIKKKSKEQKQYNEKENELGYLCFTYWDGVSKTKSNSKILSVFCPKCHEDPVTKQVHDKGMFKQTASNFRLNSIRCGCGKSRLKTLESVGVDGFIGMTKTTVHGNVLTIKDVKSISKGRIKSYIYECNVCSKDEDLYPYGSLHAPKGTFMRDNFYG